MLTFLAGVAVGGLVVGVLFVVFGKHNQNLINTLRTDILQKVDEVKNVVK